MLKTQLKLIIVLLVSECKINQDFSVALLVNNVQQNTRKHHHSVIYNYGDGDVVDVSCVCLKSKCDLQMNYDYATMLDDAFKTKYSSYGVGFRFKLEVAHNYSQITCNCIDCQETILVTFILQHAFNNVLNLKINSLVVREVRPRPVKRFYILMTNAFQEKEYINIECDANKEDVVLHMNTYALSRNTNIRYLNQTKRHIDLKISSDNWHLTFTAEDGKRKLKQIELLFIRFSLLGRPQLIVDLPREKVLMDFYNYEGQNVIYYEFDDGDRLNLNCYTPSRYTFQSVITFISPVTKQISPYSIQSEFQLSSSLDNKTIQCLLTRGTDDTGSISQEKWGQAIIRLHQKKRNTSEYYQLQDTYTIIFCSLAGIVVIILVLFLLYRYWWIRRQKDSSKMSFDDTALELKSSRPTTLSTSENDYHIYESITDEKRISDRGIQRYVNIAQGAGISRKCETGLYANVS
ncbi:unnamed protein product [Arctia plantaginis]|uniref:CUB domain-containing protein n=1 Tax=Arctia plantaginis TaxID=874455 RepID=A0A8S1BIN2_ARCPL|nr:unnamed protein product [Arctia plantaginis]